MERMRINRRNRSNAELSEPIQAVKRFKCHSDGLFSLSSVSSARWLCQSEFYLNMPDSRDKIIALSIKRESVLAVRTKPRVRGRQGERMCMCMYVLYIFFDSE